MGNYALETGRYMTAPVEVIEPTAMLSEAYDILDRRGFSSLAVVDDRRVVGVVSRTDLLRVGRRRSKKAPPESPLLDLPSDTVASVMTRTVASVDEGAALRDAARVMLDNRYHRVYVTQRGALAGVLSTRDLMAAIRDLRDETVIGQHMSTPIKAFDAHGSVGDATNLLADAGIGGLVIVEGGWPIGTYTQVDAMHARDLPVDTPVEEAMSLSLVCVPPSMRMHRAAAQAVRLGTRRLIAVDNDTAVGILSGLDFARCAAA